MAGKKMRNFFEMAEAMQAELDEAIERANTLARTLRDPYRDTHPLNRAARKYFQLSHASLKELVDIMLPIWKSENRLSASGRTIKLGEEAFLFAMKEGDSIDVYDLYEAMQALFSKNPPPPAK